MKELVCDVLVIGGGPAGIFASSLAHIKGLKPILIEANEVLGGQPALIYSQKSIEDYPGYTNIKAYQLVNNFIDQFMSKKITHFLSTSINDIKRNDDGFSITLTNQKKVNAKAIIIATGIGKFSCNLLEIKHNHNKVKYIVDDVNKYKSKQVIILGGGDSAVDWANELSYYAKSISIVHRRDEFRANGENVKRLKTNKVHIYLNYNVKEIKNNKLIIVDNNNKSISLNFDEILVQYGQKIDNDHLKCFEGLLLNDKNRIPVAINQMTNLNNIYAIGNICIYEGKPSSIICAHGEATVAVRDIINKLKPYEDKKK